MILKKERIFFGNPALQLWLPGHISTTLTIELLGLLLQDFYALYLENALIEFKTKYIFLVS